MKNFTKNSIVVAVAVSVVLGFSGPITVFAAGPASVNLGSAGNFVILSKTGVSTTGATSIVGDLGVSPAAASYITGFALTLPAASAFSTSALVTGKVYASDYANPTPATLTTAILDMQSAYTDAAGRASDVTELGAGNIGGLTLAPGVYKWGTGLTIPTDVTLSGGANDVWIFQIAQTLTLSSATKVVLAGGAQASNIFWVVGGQTTLGTTSVFNGTILDQTAIVMGTGAQLNGRALAQTAVTLDSNAVTITGDTSTSGSNSSGSNTTTSNSTGSNSSGSNSNGSSSSGSNSTASDSNQPASSDTITALQARRDQLLLAVQLLQAQRATQQGSSVPASAFGQQVRAIAMNLGQGGRGNDVATLQLFLISQNKGPAARALASVGATSYFGNLTRSALAEFQANVGISPALGNFGPITRAYVSAHY